MFQFDWTGISFYFRFIIEDAKGNNLLKNMYNSVKACVKSDLGRTQCFKTSSTVLQGCKLSLIFILCLNELCIDICDKYAHGIFITQEIENIMFLLFVNIYIFCLIILLLVYKNS